ncbi:MULTISPECIES: GrpB family protein [unclassified Rhizobium]|uniref:GrpB family protein n=1 Tax=unclassified Rhizobium TaxID=2613769 RepID=UPI00382F5231
MRAIRIVDYDPVWPDLFRHRSEAIAALCGHLADIQHIGSTAVPGLCAKPKLDIDAVLPTRTMRLMATERLRQDGYAFHGDPYCDDRWPFTKDETPYGTRLYLSLPGNPAHRDRLLFRDYLRSHPRTAERYGALKRKLASEANGCWERYTPLKSDFVAEILRHARTEREKPS